MWRRRNGSSELSFWTISFLFFSISSLFLSSQCGTYFAPPTLRAVMTQCADYVWSAATLIDRRERAGRP